MYYFGFPSLYSVVLKDTTMKTDFCFLKACSLLLRNPNLKSESDIQFPLLV